MTRLREGVAYNKDGYIYINGDANTDGSKRFHLHPESGFTAIQQRTDGIWRPCSIQTSPNSLYLGEETGISAVGHHIAEISGEGHLHFFAHNEFDGGTSISDAQVVYAYSYGARTVIQSDNTGTWTGTTLEYGSNPSSHALIGTSYNQTDTTAATEPVRVCVWHGTDDTGDLVFDQTYPASLFAASSEIQREQHGYVEFDAGDDYFTRYSSDANFSLKMDVTNATPWLAANMSLIREDNLLQTKPWVDGDSWTAGDYYIEDRKFYVCNTTGAQSGTFASNSALWNELSYHAPDRIVSADGLSYAIMSNGNFDVTRSGNLVIACNSINTAIKAPTTASTKMAVSNTDARIDYEGIPRVDITDAHSQLIAKNESTYLIIKNTKIEHKFKGDIRQLMDLTKSYIKGPDLSQTLKVTDVGAYYNNGEILTALDKGVANGVAELDALGIVPTAQLPGYVDAIVEYASLAALVAADPQEANKIYITIDDNKMYRYTGTAGSYGEISPTIVLGSTNTTAYRGDRGTIAYDHSQLVTEHIDWTGASDDLSTDSSVITTGGGQSGKFLTGGAGATVFSFTGGSFDVRAGSGMSSTQNTLKITSAGVLTFDDLTRIRLGVDATSAYIVSPDGTKNLTLTDTDLKFSDAGGDKFIISNTGIGLFSPSGVHSIVVADAGATYDTVEIATVDDLHAEYTHPTGDGNLHVSVTETLSEGKVLTAGATAGSFNWETPGLGHDADTIISGGDEHTLIAGDDFLEYKHYTPGTGGYSLKRIKVTDDRVSLFSNDGAEVYLTDTHFVANDGNLARIWFDPEYTHLESGGAVNQLTLTDSSVIVKSNGNNRIVVNDAGTSLSASSGANLSVAVAGSTFYKNLTIQQDGEAATLKAVTVGTKAFMAFRKSDGTRMGWMGFGSSGDYRMGFYNDNVDDDIELTCTGTGQVNVNAPIQAESYKSADGTVGHTGTLGAQLNLTFKNGLCVGYVI